MKRLLNIIAAISACVTLMGAELNPVANPEAVVTEGMVRFTVLTPEMIRVEYSPLKQFEDRATFTVVNRNLPVPHFTKSEDDEFLYINTDKLKLRYRKGTNPYFEPNPPGNLNITMALNGRPVTWFPGQGDGKNLKGTCRTLDRCFGDGYRYVKMAADKARPEGGVGEPENRYGNNSGAYDQLGWGTLMLYR